jgi:hypothetical protein
LKKCVVCSSSYESNYPHKKTCGIECSRILKKNNRKQWVLKNRDSFLEYRKQYYYSKDRDKVRERCKKYRNSERGREVRRNQQKNRILRDPIYRVKRCLRKRLWEYKKRLGTVSMSSIIGCSWDEFKAHIESRFYPNPVTGEMMTWENYGKNGWEIDHIKPLCSAKNLDELIKLSHYTNLQPLWAIDNVKKSIEERRGQIPETNFI